MVAKFPYATIKDGIELKTFLACSKPTRSPALRTIKSTIIFTGNVNTIIVIALFAKISSVILQESFGL